MKQLVLPSASIRRDLTCALLIVSGLVGFGRNLNNYLQEIGHPWIVVTGFWLSLAIAIWHEWKFPFYRLSFAKIAATTWMFSLAAYMASPLRRQYVEMLEFIWHQPEAAQVFGIEVVAAMRARLIGFGGCYGAALMLMRLVAYKGMQRIFIAGLVPLRNRPAPCPHCGQLINHSAG